MEKILEISSNLLGVLVTGLLAKYILFDGVASHYSYRVEIIAGILAFLGAIIGGGFTLMGVIYTINNNIKREKLNNLPSKIFKINKAITLISDTAFNEFPHSPYKHISYKVNKEKPFSFEGALLYLDSINQFKYKESSNKIIKSIPDTINELLFTIDINTYYNYLQFSSEIASAKKFVWEATGEVLRIKNSHESLHYYDYDEQCYKTIESIESKDEVCRFLNEFIGECVITDNKLRSLLQEAYFDLIRSLESEREKMLQEIDK